ncbi:HAD family hydrolase [Spirulina subsalsa FACHB-351]|uniref:HAD family hydrolase n=1 Tax=Spirulina subsalsa FACHB-351 TaxID=234711 RepID=A0ABT3L800_9CYAN|nr:HAD family hydrolase [Spirulina subsalsa]MCW6037642.1 HAD family hydrolase [Spirulina subsalsa FACHB-351]
MKSQPDLSVPDLVPPDILALDFDGVICDGLREYFQTTCRAYEQLWPHPVITPLADYASRFYRLRPVIETGWEMPVLVRALVLGREDEEILQHWPDILGEMVAGESLDKQAIAHCVDGVRDRWIEENLDQWLSLHRFYPGVLDKLRHILSQNTPQLYIVTTKEGRFVQRLLSQQGIEIPSASILGKEVKRPKYQTLGQLIQDSPLSRPRLWFVEDRLKALQDVIAHGGLENSQLFLADWGYNTAPARTQALQDPIIHLLSLEQFGGHWSGWGKG